MCSFCEKNASSEAGDGLFVLSLLRHADTLKKYESILLVAKNGMDFEAVCFSVGHDMPGVEVIVTPEDIRVGSIFCRSLGLFFHGIPFLDAVHVCCLPFVKAPPAYGLAVCRCVCLQRARHNDSENTPLIVFVHPQRTIVLSGVQGDMGGAKYVLQFDEQHGIHADR